MSIEGGIRKAFQRGVDVGCRTIQVFVKSPTRWQTPPVSEGEAGACRREKRRTRLAPVIAHASYLINISSVDDSLWEKSIASLSDELVRAATIGARSLVLHPGSFKGADREFGIERAAVALSRVLAGTPTLHTRIALETTAGAGAMLGGSFEEIADVLQRLPRGRMEVCLDTCHVHAAGYDITTPRRLAGTLGQFDSVIGLSRLAVIHLNDCKGEVGSHLDRHEHIGRGRIGPAAFRRIMRLDRFRRLPKILETPKHDQNGRSMDPVNLKVLSRFAE